MASNKGTSLRKYALVRLALVVPMVFVLLTMVFLLMRVAPGDPISASLGGHAPQSEIDRIKAELGYDKPIYQQYFEYLGQIAHGDLGTTITDRRPVTDIIRENGAATLELTFYAMIVAIIVGVTFGLLAGRYRDTWIDGTGRLFGIVIYAMPVFFLGLHGAALLRLVPWLAADLRSSEPDRAGDDGDPHGSVHGRLAHQPGLACVHGLGQASGTAGRHAWPRDRGDLYPPHPRERHPHDEGRLHRGCTCAGNRRALGRVPARVQERARSGHHDRRSRPSRSSCRGAVLTETTFNWPGIGHTLLTYLQNRDYAAVQGIIIVFALVVVVASVIIDFVNAYIDPRIRY